jgi:hypothetical protein
LEFCFPVWRAERGNSSQSTTRSAEPKPVRALVSNPKPVSEIFSVAEVGRIALTFVPVNVPLP